MQMEVRKCFKIAYLHVTTEADVLFPTLVTGLHAFLTSRI